MEVDEAGNDVKMSDIMYGCGLWDGHLVARTERGDLAIIDNQHGVLNGRRGHWVHRRPHENVGRRSCGQSGKTDAEKHDSPGDMRPLAQQAGSRRGGGVGG